jgi:TetR/AcrR family transcriptional regulator, transcriptional repressor for nem operon
MSQVIQRSLSEEVLDKTMNLFWEKGYFNTSIDDIAAVTGLNRAALYKYYGGKDKLFLAMLERFRKNITNKVTIPLQTKKNGIEGIATFFIQFLELYDSAGLRSRGCFLISTAVDIHSHNKEVNYFIKDFLDDMRTKFRNLLIHTKTEKLLKSEVDIDSSADFLVGNLFGLMTLCRSSAPRQVFENHVCGITTFLASLSTNAIIKRKESISHQ